MLKKNLLLMGRKKEQRKVKLTIGRYESFGMGVVFGYNKVFYGSLDVVPYWGTTNDVLNALLYMYALDSTSLGAPSGVTAFVEGYTQGISNAVDGDIYAMNNATNSIRYLTFDPPRWVLGSKNTQTDLRRGYYVEEVPWEAQDAEQGTSDGGRRRGVVDSTIQVHRGLLYRSNPTGLKQSNPLGGTPKRRYCDGSSASKEYPDTLRDCWSSRHSKSRWVPSGRRQARRKHHIATKRCVSRAIHRSVVSKEALYA